MRKVGTYAHLSVLAFGLAVGGCGPPPAETVGEEGSAIVDGTPSRDDPSVVALRAYDGLVCTATVVSPHAALTAAHCFTDGLVPNEVFFGDGQRLPIAGVVVHPEFQREALTNDVAVVAFAEPRNVASPFDAPAGALEGARLRIVGYGSGGRERTSGTVRLDRLDASAFVVKPSPSSPCTGDSGGPAFARVAEREYLVGIASSGDVACADHARYTRVDAYRGWLDEEIARAEPPPASSRGCASARARGAPLSLPAAVAPLLVLAWRRARRFVSRTS